MARFELLGMSEHAQQILAKIGLEANLVLEILAIGHLKRAKAGRAVLTPESTTQEMPIVLTGLLKVMRQNAHQDEVFLYYIEAGETCAMSITCCLEAKKVSYKVVCGRRYHYVDDSHNLHRFVDYKIPFIPSFRFPILSNTL